MSKLDFTLLQDSGYVFMWVTNLSHSPALHFMEGQGYNLTEVITWVKVQQSGT